MKVEQAMGLGLEKQVTSLELSKELRDLGVKQDSYFWWYHKRGQKWHIDSLLADRFLEDIFSVSAPTFAELLEVLPDEIVISKNTIAYGKEMNYFLFITKTRKTKWFNLPDYYISYKTLDDVFLHSEREDTIVDAAAKVIIYLIKEGIIKVNEK